MRGEGCRRPREGGEGEREVVGVGDNLQSHSQTQGVWLWCHWNREVVYRLFAVAEPALLGRLVLVVCHLFCSVSVWCQVCDRR